MEIKGIDKEKVELISNIKKEDSWVKKFRLDSYEKFEKLGMQVGNGGVICMKENLFPIDKKNNYIPIELL